MDCIFCKIGAGEIPAHKVYEDENILAFLDLNPKSFGHTLIIPKCHYKDLLDINVSKVDYMQEIIKVAKIIVNKLECDGFNLINNCGSIAGQEVFHVHFHVVPQYNNEQINKEKLDFDKVIEKLK